MHHAVLPLLLLDVHNITVRDMICGVDESGVGSIIGPMVFAGVAMQAESSRTLRRWGVADSKTLPCSAVSAIYKRIASAPQRMLMYRTSEITPRELDMATADKVGGGGRRGRGARLREAKISRVADIIVRLAAACSAANRRIEAACVDSFDADAPRLSADIASAVSSRIKFAAPGPRACETPRIVCRTGADGAILPVAAASIVAVATYRQKMREIHRAMASRGYAVGDAESFDSEKGGMYRYIYDYYQSHSTLPGFVRANCRPMRRLVSMCSETGRTQAAGAGDRAAKSILK